MVNLSAAALARESAGYVWQFKIRILHLCGLSKEHQNSTVDIEFMKNLYCLALTLHFVSSMQYVLKMMES